MSRGMAFGVRALPMLLQMSGWPALPPPPLRNTAPLMPWLPLAASNGANAAAVHIPTQLWPECPVSEYHISRFPSQLVPRCSGVSPETRPLKLHSTGNGESLAQAW